MLLHALPADGRMWQPQLARFASSHRVWALLRRPDPREQLVSIPVPVTVIHGADDRLISQEEARSIAGMIPDVLFAELKGAGHLANLEQPQAAKVILESFFARL